MPDPLDQLRAALAGRYALEPELGSGGMATVYLAEDLKHHRKVAVKVLRPELAVAIGAERFSREIEIAARLQHPHILPLLDSGILEMPGDPGGRPYYVMPFVEGESLRDRLRRGELLIEDAVRILTEVVDALAYATKCFRLPGPRGRRTAEPSSSRDPTRWGCSGSSLSPSPVAAPQRSHTPMFRLGSSIDMELRYRGVGSSSP
jgi:aminoglycoside phosphotransferase (APT) family kinase protein